MKRWIMAIALAGYAAGPATAQDLCDARGTFALALHGGAFDQGESLETVSGAPLAFLKDAAADGRKALRDGATAVDAVTQMVRAMEASALFNAGRASIVNEKGFVENDASIMEGAELNAGAVGSLIDTKSPITAARLVMENSRHVMVVGDRGEAYVRALGAEAAPDAWFTRATSKSKAEHGTVGAVALDRCGDLAAATSTGGYGTKVPGRLGDVPVIGAGTYADNRGAAVSATGHGEWFIRHAAAHAISERVRLLGEDVEKASRYVLDAMAAKEGLGAVIVLDAKGRFAVKHSSLGVAHAFADEDTAPYARVFEKD